MPSLRAPLTLILLLAGALPGTCAAAEAPPAPVLATPVEGTLPNGLR